MMKKYLIGLICCVVMFGSERCFALETKDYEKLVPFYENKKDPGPLDWLAQHPEQGQTLSEFLALQHPIPDKKQSYIDIVLLGDFNDEQKTMLEMARRYIEVYFQTPVRFSAPISLSVIPPHARRNHPQTKDPQILSTYVIDDVLKPRMPKDAFAFIAFTSVDLWPGEGWNFVFGQASMEDRIGVWSLYRNGDPKEDFQLALRRTIQTGTHEIGHLFGLYHCIYYECNMNGSNSRVESDKRPLWDCPICLRKLSSRKGFDPVKRYRELIAICAEFGFGEEERFFKKNLSVLEKR